MCNCLYAAKSYCILASLSTSHLLTPFLSLHVHPTHTHTHTHTPKQTCTDIHPHARTHARTHMRTHTHSHTHTHTHAHTRTQDWGSEVGDVLQTVLSAGDQVVAVGETGLNYNRMFSTIDQQKTAFTAQVINKILYMCVHTYVPFELTYSQPIAKNISFV